MGLFTDALAAFLSAMMESAKNNANFVSVVSGIDPSSNKRIGDCCTNDSHLGLRSHRHAVYGSFSSVPSKAGYEDLVNKMGSYGTALNDAAEKIRQDLNHRLDELIVCVHDVSALNKAFDGLVSSLSESISQEQSSHRRFEQLVQTLLAAHSEVKELYDTIGGAIKKATESSSTGAIKLIEDKGRVVTSSVEALFKERTARIEADLPKMVESVFKDVFDKLRTQYVAETEKMSANASAELEEKVSGQLDLIEKRGGEILAAMSQAAVSQQTGIRDLVAKGSSDLHADLDAEIPSLFRSSGGKTTFGQRLKWLLLGKV